VNADGTRSRTDLPSATPGLPNHGLRHARGYRTGPAGARRICHPGDTSRREQPQRLGSRRPHSAGGRRSRASRAASRAPCRIVQTSLIVLSWFRERASRRTRHGS
jgi:hypothetical protein